MNISDLLKLWRLEKASPQLAKMPAEFYRDSHDLISDKNPYESKKAKDLFNDILHMRQHKMLMACLRQLQGGDKPENLLTTEKIGYDNIYRELESMHLKGGDEERAQDRRTRDVENDARLAAAEAEEAKDSRERRAIGSEEPEPKEQHEKKERRPGAEKAKLEAERASLQGEAERGIASAKAGLGEETEDSMLEDISAGAEEGDLLDEGQASETVETAGQAKKKAPHAGKTASSVFKGKTENKALKRVRFLRSMPAVVGPDLKSVGPFEEGQVAELDGEVAEILAKNDVVEFVEPESE